MFVAIWLTFVPQSKGNALCTSSLWISNFIVAQVTPPIASAISWGLYLILAAINVVAFLFVRYCLGMCTQSSVDPTLKVPC